MKTRLALASFVIPALLSAVVGSLVGPGLLHPAKRPVGPEIARAAEQVQRRTGASREDVTVRAPDGTYLRGWKMRPPSVNGEWVLLFHGVSDNRGGMLPYAEFLLRHGYAVALMDARAHGASGGAIASYGWQEREDVRAVVDALFATETVHCLFALGESMGAAIALQSAAVEPRIRAVVAESPFVTLREVAYDYAGMRLSPWLGKTLFRLAVITALRRVEGDGGFRVDDVSPEAAVARRPFPVLLICGTKDRNIPPRHTRALFDAATGPKEMWLVDGAGHTGALGVEPEEFERRVVGFYRKFR